MTLKPLALTAALSLAAAVSQAQLLVPTTGGSTGSGSPLLNLGGGFDMAQKGDDLSAQAPLSGGDFYKKCGTVPYRTCTPEEEKARQQWLKDAAKEKASAPAPVAGPPQVVKMPQGDGKMLQYPDGRVEYCFDDSCTKTNGTPLTPDQARSYYWNDFADQKQMANSINGGAANRNANPQLPPGATCTQLSCDLPPVNASNSGGGASTPSNDQVDSSAGGDKKVSGFSALMNGNGGSGGSGATTGNDSSAADDASAVTNAQDAVNGGGSRSLKGSGGGGDTSVTSSGGSSGSGSGGSSGSSGGSSGGGKRMNAVKAVDGRDGTYSYTALMPAVETTIKAGEAIKSGQTEFANPDGATINTGNRAELKVEDQTKLGKIKVSHQ